MSRKAYSEEEREGIRVGLMDRAMTLFSEKGIRDTNIDEIYTPLGISKTFFYSFFPTKSHLAISIVEREMARIGELFRDNVWKYGAENGMRETFREVISGRYYVLSMDDQAYLRSQMTEEDLMRFRNDVIVLFSDMLYTVGVPASGLDPRVFCNLVMSVLTTRMADENSLVLTYPEASDDTTDIQLEQLDTLVSLVMGKRVR